MKAVGIRDLKAHLSRYLEEVRHGEIVLVTDRGHVVAELRRPVRTVPVESELERRLWPLVESGELRLGFRPGPPLRPTGVQLEDGVIERLLGDLREESGR